MELIPPLPDELAISRGVATTQIGRINRLSHSHSGVVPRHQHIVPLQPSPPGLTGLHLAFALGVGLIDAPTERQRWKPAALQWLPETTQGIGVSHAPITEAILDEGRGIHDQVLTVLNLGIQSSSAPVVTLPTQLQRAGASRIVSGETTGTGVACCTIGRHIVGRRAGSAFRCPTDAHARTFVFVVGPRRSIHREHIEDRITGIDARPDREHVFLANNRAGGDGDLIPQREGIEELVDRHQIGAITLLKRGFQGGQT